MLSNRLIILILQASYRALLGAISGLLIRLAPAHHPTAHDNRIRSARRVMVSFPRAGLFQRGVTTCLLAASILRFGVAVSDTPSRAQGGSPLQPQKTADVFVPPAVTFLAENYPAGILAEGWVYALVMVGTNGKPIDATILESNGYPAFDEEALHAVKHADFQPALLNGRPIVSVFIRKQYFLLHESGRAGYGEKTGPKFAHAFDATMTAIKMNDRVAADSAKARLRVTNLFEDAHMGLVNYSYALQWGDEGQALAGLRQAIASEIVPKYLSEAEFKEALLACIKLELKARDYPSAILHWRVVQRTNNDHQLAEAMKPVLDRLTQLSVDDSKYDVDATLLTDSWHQTLFKKHFRLHIKDGSIAQLKLFCSRAYATPEFDQATDYSTPENGGECLLYLKGIAGTHFTLTQF